MDNIKPLRTPATCSCRNCGDYLVMTAGGLIFCQTCNPTLPEEIWEEHKKMLEVAGCRDPRYYADGTKI